MHSLPLVLSHQRHADDCGALEFVAQLLVALGIRLRLVARFQAHCSWCSGQSGLGKSYGLLLLIVSCIGVLSAAQVALGANVIRGHTLGVSTGNNYSYQSRAGSATFNDEVGPAQILFLVVANCDRCSRLHTIAAAACCCCLISSMRARHFGPSIMPLRAGQSSGFASLYH